jgi:aminopeptidase N
MRQRTPAAAAVAFLIVGAATWIAASAEPKFSFDATGGQLPKNVVPVDYEIAIEPDVDAALIHGRETVHLKVREATALIRFNSVGNVLADVRLDGKPVEKVETDEAHQVISLTLAAPATVGPHELSFSYTGKIGTGPQGLFAQQYVTPDGTKGLLLSTQFETTYARRMFPCWDEPSFRATYALTATIRSGWTAVGNMPVAERTEHDGRTTIRFERTPAMAAYLVEFTAGDIASLSGKSGTTDLGVWAVRGQEGKGATALANARQILADYNAYFGYPFPLPKLDSIAVPGGFTGAMENWGAITYNDQILLLGESSTVGDRQTAYSIQAHEMAHQWYGDLVTMAWWDNLWLNESFASWMAAKQTDLRNPSWDWWQEQDESKESAMRADARASSHAIQQPVANELQAENAMDPQITYDKGQAVLRMLEAYLGPEVFRDGVRRYMKDRAFSNATSADLWGALGAASHQDVAAIAQAWIGQPGFPIVSVAASCDAAGARTIRLTQSRFLLSSNAAAPGHWSIPLQLRSGGDAVRPVLLTQDGASLPAGHCEEPLSVNAGAVGYFRVAYDDATLQRDIRAFSSLPPGDRIALLDDEWALVEKGTQPLASYLAMVTAMGTDLNVRAWDQIAHALATIERDERGTPGHDAFAALARGILRPVADKLGFDALASETPGRQRLRRTVLGDLGAWGDPQVVALMRQRFAAFQKDHAALAPDDQEMVMTVVARNADAAQFEQLHEVARHAKDETELRRYYPALTQVRDHTLAEKAAAIALSDEIPPQAADLQLQMVAMLSSENPALSWTTFTANADKLLAPMPMMAPLIISQYIPEFYWNAVALDQLEAWSRSHVPAEMAPNVERGMESARFKRAEKDRMVAAADQFVSAHSPGTR